MDASRSPTAYTRRDESKGEIGMMGEKRDGVKRDEGREERRDLSQQAREGRKEPRSAGNKRA